MIVGGLRRKRPGRAVRDVSILAGTTLFFALVMGSFIFGCASATKKDPPDVDQVTAEEISAGPSFADFVVGPGDQVEVKVWRNENLNFAQTITPSGELHYPLIGDIKAAGMTIEELRDSITEGLSKYLVNPYVTMDVETSASQKVFVLGEVNRPGIFPIVGPMSALEAISTAQGFTLDAAPESVMLIRGGKEVSQLALLDLKSVMKEGNLSENVTLRGGDILYVPVSKIADVERYFSRIRNILRTIVTVEQMIILGPLVGDALEGETTRAIISTGG